MNKFILFLFFLVFYIPSWCCGQEIIVYGACPNGYMGSGNSGHGAAQVCRKTDLRDIERELSSPEGKAIMRLADIESQKIALDAAFISAELPEDKRSVWDSILVNSCNHGDNRECKYAFDKIGKIRLEYRKSDIGLKTFHDGFVIDKVFLLDESGPITYGAPSWSTHINYGNFEADRRRFLDPRVMCSFRSSIYTMAALMRIWNEPLDPIVEVIRSSRVSNTYISGGIEASGNGVNSVYSKVMRRVKKGAVEGGGVALDLKAVAIDEVVNAYRDNHPFDGSTWTSGKEDIDENLYIYAIKTREKLFNARLLRYNKCLELNGVGVISISEGKREQLKSEQGSIRRDKEELNWQSSFMGAK